MNIINKFFNYLACITFGDFPRVCQFFVALENRTRTIPVKNPEDFPWKVRKFY